MSKSRLVLIVLVAVLLVIAARPFGQAPTGQGGAAQRADGRASLFRQPQVPVTERDKAAARELAQKLLALNISQSINNTAKSTIDGSIAAAGRGGGRGDSQIPNETTYPPTPASKEVIEKLVSVLQSSASTRWQKSDALRQLSVVGTKDIVPVVAPLLGDAEFSHMARYALEPIPDPSVDTVFRDALGKLQGQQMAGVITSIGVRRDAQAAELVARQLQNPDAGVVKAAALSLGRIGNAAAAKSLQSAVASAPAAHRPVLTEGLLRCAESLASHGQDATAVALYDQLLDLDDSVPVRTAALRGAILARKADGVLLLRQHLRGSDATLFIAAAKTAQEMTAAGTTQALMDALAKLSKDDDKVLVIRTLGIRGDAAAVPALLPLAQGGSKIVSLAAIEALPQVPQAASVPVLLGLMNNADAEIAAAAKISFAAIPVQEADAAVLVMLRSNQPNERITGIEMVGSRGIRASIPDLIKMAGSHSDPKVRLAALKTTSNIGGTDSLGALLELALSIKTLGDMDAAVSAIRSVLANVNVEDKAGFTQNLLGRFGQASPAQKPVLLRLLSINGGTEGLGTVQSAVSDSNAQVHEAALQALIDWPDFAAAKPLIDIAAKSSTPLTDSVLALKGGMRLIRANLSAPLTERVALCLTGYDSARRDEERREVISVMGTVRSAEIGQKLIDIATNNPALKAEAGAAASQVVSSLYTGLLSSGRGGRGR